jgi:hypothetical protein
MAKKALRLTRNRGQKAQDARRGDKNVAYFSSAAERLRILAGEIAALVDVMREMDIEKITMDGATKFDRGIVEIGAFLNHARRVLDTAKIKRLTARP